MNIEINIVKARKMRSSKILKSLLSNMNVSPWIYSSDKAGLILSSKAIGSDIKRIRML